MKENQILHLKKRAIRIYKKYRPKIVFIIGSEQSRTLQKFCFEVLREKHDIQEKVVRNEFDVALSFLGISSPIKSPADFIKSLFRYYQLLLKRKPYPDVFIFTLEPEKRGEIKRICQELLIDVLIVSDFNVPPDFAPGFKKEESYIFELKKIFPFLTNKTIIVGSKDMLYREGVRPGNKIKIVSLFEKGSEINLKNIQIKTDDYYLKFQNRNQGTYFQLQYDQNVMPIRLSYIVSRSQAEISLFAIALALIFKMNMVKVAEVLSKARPYRGDMNPIQGIKDTLIVRNSSNISVERLLESFEETRVLFSPGKKICVIGGFENFKNGKTGISQRRVGKKISECFDEVVLFGENMEFMESELLRQNFQKEQIHRFQKIGQIRDELKSSIIKPKDLIFLSLQGKIEKEFVKEIRA